MGTQVEKSEDGMDEADMSDGEWMRRLRMEW